MPPRPTTTVADPVPPGRGATPPTRTFRERLGAIRNVPPFLAMIWATSRWLTVGTVLLRLIRAVLPVLTLYVGKLIIDEVMARAAIAGTPGTISGWLQDVASRQLLWLLAAELGLAVLSDVLGRLVALFDALLSEQFSNATSIRLMQHAATLDLEDFEDSEQQDKLERARRQASGRMTLMNQLFGQAQDLITIVSFGIGMVAYAPWLIVLLFVALIPAFLGEAYFNERSYSLAYSRTADRRELDYIRQTGASVETAKEVKIFGLNTFLIDRYRTLAGNFYVANRSLAIRRASWGGFLTALGTLGYYIAYALIVFRTLTGQFSIGDLTFLAGSFRRLRTLLIGTSVALPAAMSFCAFLPNVTASPVRSSRSSAIWKARPSSRP
jgi:ATP-binding cassette subfamily B protein